MVYTGRMKHTLTITFLLVLAIAFFAQGQGNMVTTKSGLKYIDQKVGTGETAVKGAKVEVNYTGWLYVNGKRGSKFDSSLDRNMPFPFTRNHAVQSPSTATAHDSTATIPITTSIYFSSD